MQLHVDLTQVLDKYHFAQLGNRELDRANRYGYCLSVAKVALTSPKITPCLNTVDQIHKLGEHIHARFRADDIVGWDAAEQCWHVVMPFCHEDEVETIQQRLDESMADVSILNQTPEITVKLTEMDAKHYHIGHLIPSVDGLASGALRH